MLRKKEDRKKERKKELDLFLFFMADQTRAGGVEMFSPQLQLVLEHGSGPLVFTPGGVAFALQH